MQALTFGGFDLTHYCYVRIERPIAAPMSYETSSVPGRDGDVVTSAALEALEVTAHCTLKGAFIAQWDAVRVKIAEAFSKRTPQELRLPDEDGLRRMATATLQGTLTMPMEPPVEFDVLFCDHDCRALKGTSSEGVPSGGSATFVVEHDMPNVSVSADAAIRDSATGMWSVTFDGDCTLCVEVPTPVQTPISIDCARREVTVDGEVAMITPESDWPELSAGEHTVAMSLGTGAATLTWTERCL